MESSMLHVDLFESEAIAKFAYDLTARRLVIFFKSGGAYEYQDVPREIFDGFRAAESKGQYFQASIRPQFVGRALSPGDIAGVELSPGRSAACAAENVILVELASLAGSARTAVFF